MDSTLSYTRIHDDVLSSIDDIDDVVLESEFSVLNAMLDSYNKATIIMENYNGDAIDSFSIFQEEGILDEATGKKSEALITRILAFIPRLIMAIGKRLIGCSKNEDIKEAAAIIKEEETNEAPMTPEEKTRVQKWREEHSDSTVDIDGAKNKFLKFTGNIKEKCHLLSVTKDLFARIHEVLDKDEPSAYRDLSKEFKDIASKNKGFSAQTVSIAFSAASQLFNDAGLLADEAGSAALEAGKKLTDVINAKINDPNANEKTLEKQIAIKELADSINVVGSVASDTVKSINDGAGFVKWVWGHSKSKYEGGKKKKLKKEIDSVKKQIKAYEKSKVDAKEIEKLRKKLADYEAKLANMKDGNDNDTD